MQDIKQLADMNFEMEQNWYKKIGGIMREDAHFCIYVAPRKYQKWALGGKDRNLLTTCVSGQPFAPLETDVGCSLF